MLGAFSRVLGALSRVLAALSRVLGALSIVLGALNRVLMPFTKIFASDGTPMEMQPRPVDVAVTRPLGERASVPTIRHIRKLGDADRALGNERAAYEGATS